MDNVLMYAVYAKSEIDFYMLSINFLLLKVLE